MPVFSIFTLEESNVTVSGGQQLSGISQGDGSHLVGETLTLNSRDWVEIPVNDTDDTNFNDSDNSQSLDSPIVYDGVSYNAGLRVEAEFGLSVQDPDGNTYELYAFNINEPGVTSYSTVEGLGFVGEFPPIGVPLTVVTAREGESNPYTSLAQPPCFTTGCRISVRGGAKRVEELEVGDWVDTQDNGPQQVRWIGSRIFDAAALRRNPKLRPIRITAGALGAGLPVRDLLVSRQHRMIVSSKIVMRMVGEAQALVATNKLTALPGIYVDETVDAVEYVHVMFDRHEVIFAEGAPTESLFAGAEALKAVSREARAEILDIFPHLGSPVYAPHPVRHIPPNAKQSKLAARHARNGVGLLSAR